MELDIREILYEWLHFTPYYGESGECESVWLATKGRGYGNPDVDWRADALYEGVEERVLAKLDLDLALGRLQRGHQHWLRNYLRGLVTVPFTDWPPLPVELHLALANVFIPLIKEVSNNGYH